MSRVNVDAQAFVDSRFARLAHEMGWGDPDFAIGKMARLWLECTLRETETLMGYEVGFAWNCDGDKAYDALVASGLAEEWEDADTLRIKGCKGRIEWLEKLRNNGKYGKLGGRPKGSRNKPTRVSRNKPTRVSKKNPRGSEIKTPPTPTPTPTPDPTLARPSAGIREVSLLDLSEVYDMYPLKKGKRAGMAKAAKTIVTRKEFERYQACVEHMAKAFAGDTTYCPHFSTFVNQRLWEDDEWPSPRAAPKPPTRRRGLSVADIAKLAQEAQDEEDRSAQMPDGTVSQLPQS